MDNESLQDEEFIRFLQEGTAEFKMYPSRKIWYGIYNDMHPARKWPSLAVSLLLLISMVYLGINTNNSLSKKDTILHAQRIAAGSIFLASNNTVFESPTDRLSHSKSRSHKKNLFPIIAETRETIIPEKEPTPVDTEMNTTTATPVSSATIPTNDYNITIAENNSHARNEATKTSDGAENKIAINNMKTSTDNSSTLPKESSNSNFAVQENSIEKPVIAMRSELLKKPKETSTGSEDLIATAVTQISSQKTERTEEKKIDSPVESTEKENLDLTKYKPIVENKAALKTPNLIAKASSINYYISPSVGFRTLRQGGALEIPVAPQATVVNTLQPAPLQNVNDKVTQQYAINLEAGATIIFPVSKRLSWSAGLQFNYTNYEISARNIGHSVQVDMIQRTTGNNGVLVSKASSYANTLSEYTATLNNSTSQVSIPFGLQYKILGNKNISWLAGVSLQPTYTIGGNAYVLSADNRHYISAPSMLRRLNANAGLESYLSIKTGKGISFIIGPQVRYQIFSNYKSTYNYKEKLYNAGVKVGINKSF